MRCNKDKQTDRRITGYDKRSIDLIKQERKSHKSERERERERGFTSPQLAQGRGSGVILFKSLVISRKIKINQNK